jgi:hypothetical protein
MVHDSTPELVTFQKTVTAPQAGAAIAAIPRRSVTI